MKVEIWSDINCPWCAIGLGRFEQALAGLDWGDEVEVVWRAFELDPRAPGGGTDLRESIARKYGRTTAQVDDMQRGMVELGAAVGVDFRWEGVLRRNTFDAHRLLAWALETAGGAVQGDLKARLLRAHFTEGRAVDDHQVLADVAAEAGLDRAAAAEALTSGAFAEHVRADEARARELEITAVPTFLLGGVWPVSGAQEPETFRTLLERARDRLPR